MARKDIISPIYLTSIGVSVPLASQSLASNFTTVSVPIPYFDNVSLQIVVTTTDSVGSFYVQVSNDNVNFTNLSISGSPFVNAANDDIAISLNQLPFKFIRLSYVVSTAGTGTCTMQFMSKQVGGG